MLELLQELRMPDADVWKGSGGVCALPRFVRRWAW
jgi:hypothetical protein